MNNNPMRYITNKNTGQRFIVAESDTPSAFYKRNAQYGLSISARSIGRMIKGEKQSVGDYQVETQQPKPNIKPWERQKRLSAALKFDGVTYASKEEAERAQRPLKRKREPMYIHATLTKEGRLRARLFQGIVGDLAQWLAQHEGAEYDDICKTFSWSRSYTSTKISYIVACGYATIEKKSGAIGRNKLKGSL